MKRRVVTIVLLLAAAAAALAMPGVRADFRDGAGWFPVGEQFRYRIYWGVIPVGELTLESSWQERDGRRRLVLTFRARTNYVVAKLFPVDDFAETVVDPDTFLPLTYVKRLSEGRYRAHEVTTFDHAKGVALWRSLLKDRQREVEIGADTRDLLTFVYAVRSERFRPGTSEVYRVLYDTKLYDLRLRVDGKEKFRVSDYGWQKSIKMEPIAAFGGVHQREGRMWIWVSDDARRLCTKVMVKVPVASVNFLLAEVRGPGDDFWVRQGPARRGERTKGGRTK